MSGFRPFTPADGPAWLPRFADSIADLFRRILPAPLRLKGYPAAGLPAAADFAQGLAWDRDAANVAVSDGAAWRCWSFDDHGHAAGDIAFTPGGSLAADNVQAALEELDGGKAAAGHSHRNACMVRKAANQTGADYSAGTAVAWDQEVYDDGGWHDNAANNSRMTVPEGVTRVRVGGALALANVAAGVDYLINVTRNGGAGYDGRVSNSSVVPATLAPRLSLASGPIAVTPGDYFELRLQVTTDTSIDIVAAQSSFWIEAVA